MKGARFNPDDYLFREIVVLQKQHKLKVFAGARVCFVGFPEDETQHMADVLVNNGGGTCPLDDPDCTHVVSTVYSLSILIT